MAGKALRAEGSNYREPQGHRENERGLRVENDGSVRQAGVRPPGPRRALRTESRWDAAEGF